MATKKITLTLGLITIPARLGKATDEPVSFKTLCVGQGDTTHEATPITMPQTCAVCGTIHDRTLLKKGIPMGNGYAVAEQSEIAAVKAETTEPYKGKVNLVPHEAVAFLSSTAQGSSLQYLSPDSVGGDHYALIAALIEAHPELAFVTLYTPSSRVGLYLARVKDGVIVLEERTLQENLRAMPEVNGVVNEALLAQFEMILPTLVQDFEADTYRDDYATALAELTADRGAVSVDGEVASAPAKPTSDDELMSKLVALASVSTPKRKRAPRRKAA